MKTTLLFFAVFLFGCAAVGKQARFEISPAERIYRANCGICHRLYFPGAYSYQKLEHYGKKYAEGLSAEERQRLLEYLKASSKE